MGATELTEERPGKEAEGPPDDCTFNVDQDAAVAAKTSRCVYINAMPSNQGHDSLDFFPVLL
jgi:hypothetical protein